MLEKIDESQRKLNVDAFNFLKAALCLGVVAYLYYLAASEVSYRELAKDCIAHGQVEQFIDGKKRIVACATYERTALTEKFERVINGKH